MDRDRVTLRIVEREAAWWRCGCWDCQARRRSLLRLAAIVALALAVAGGAVLEYEAWRAELPASGAVTVRARHGHRPRPYSSSGSPGSGVARMASP
ncbi:MAG TPA: hypothetical protein VFP50_17175 [Anaeromyxobacteraceae bacterium]|nr:hypothetical protein [Anaeromyxobacteraceae bacterium]